MNKKFTFSKIIILIACFIFTGCLAIGLLSPKDGMIDTTIYATAITISGSILLTTICHYLKKSQAENVVKLRTMIYHSAVEERLHFNEEMIKLQKQYNISQEQIEEIDADSGISDLSDNAMSELNSSADEFIDSVTNFTEPTNL